MPCTALVLAFAASPAPQEPDAPPAVDPTRALFVEHCAQCHGLEGDGRGWAELDRPARSFLDGGFSYGNTREAVVRSIRHGIPGTPMPAFPDEVLSAGQRQALADLVIDLGPEGTIVEPGASVLRVEDRPVVVRGMLPPLTKGAPRLPRGLLIGFPSGTTFQYRADDVQLLAVRQGEFVDRRDWGNRGGAALRPLGLVTLDATAAGPLFATPSGRGLTRRLLATEILDGAVLVTSRLVPADADDMRLGGVVVQETLRVLETAVGPVPVCTVQIADDPHAAQVAGITPLPDGARLDAAFRAPDGTTHHVHRIVDGLLRVQPARVQGTPDVLHLVLAPRWSPALERALAGLPEETR